MPKRTYKIVTGFVDSQQFVDEINAVAQEGFIYIDHISFPPNKLVSIVMEHVGWKEAINEALDAIEQKSE
jgi:hypothetical protein